MTTKKIARNDPCPCGSGKEYEKCCLSKDTATRNAPNRWGVAQYYQAGKQEISVALGQTAAPANPVMYYAHLGDTLLGQGNYDAAINNYRKVLELKPDSPEVECNMGFALQKKGNLDAAIECYRRALSLKPDFAGVHSNLGLAFQAQGNFDAAVNSYRRAVALGPDFADAHFNLGIALRQQGKLDEAVSCYRQAISLQPGMADAHYNLANALQEQGNLDAAIESYRKALSLKPDFADAYCSLLLNLSYQCKAAQYLEEVRRYGNKLMEQARPYTHRADHASDTQRLRVGLVSGDLRTHPVGFFLENILEHLNPARVELVAYPTILQEDSLTARIKPRFAAWNSIANLSVEAAAQKIHSDGIHILIDLAGHTGHNRLPVFAWKPAPVQVSWLGYFASTGVPGMDYLLADSVSVPESQREHFTETVWYLPDTRLCFTPPAASQKLAITPLPAVRNGYITFGCFQRLFKINDSVLAVWGRIFHALPQARLRLQNVQMSCPVAREHLLHRLAVSGIPAERVTIVEPAQREDYFEAHAEVDIILDTFPYTGGTTTCEALWMGVPTLTIAGDTLLARQGASMLACAGLDEWIASDEDDYVARALSHATDLTRLAALRSQLREKVLASPLFDAPRFALHLEDALHGMWQKKMASVPKPD